jgi:hypothetical protein
MHPAQAELSERLASWLIRTARLDKSDSHEEARLLFLRMCADLLFVTESGDPVLPECTPDALFEFARALARVWASTPSVWAAMVTAPRVRALRLRFELDPARLLGCIVFSYVVECGVRYLEANPDDALRIAGRWSGARGTKKETGTSAASLYASIVEAILADLACLRFGGAWTGAAMLGNLASRVTPGSIKHDSDVGEFHLRGEWTRVYVLWSLSFACTLGNPEALCTLLIPSVVTGHGARWLSHRTWAMRIALVSPFCGDVARNWDLRAERRHFARQAASAMPRLSPGFVRTAAGLATRALALAYGALRARLI